MLVRSIVIVCMVLCVVMCAAQRTEKWIAKDTVDISFTNTTFDEFQVLQENSPVLPFKNGLYMPCENLWFYKIDDPGIRLASFFLSHGDTSLYLVLSKAGQDRVIWMKKTADDQQVEEVTELPLQGRHRIYPLPGHQFYLLTETSEGTFVVEFFDRKTIKVITKSKRSILTLMPLDASAFIATFINDVMLVKSGTDLINLFYSEARINDIAATDDGRIIVSTALGVYSLNKTLSSPQMICPASDGQVATFANSIFVLTNEQRKIYRYLKQ